MNISNPENSIGIEVHCLSIIISYYRTIIIIIIIIIIRYYWAPA